MLTPVRAIFSSFRTAFASFFAFDHTLNAKHLGTLEHVANLDSVTLAEKLLVLRPDGVLDDLRVFEIGILASD